MSYYKSMMSADRTEGDAFLWKINRFGQVTCEMLDREAPDIVSSNRDIMLMGSMVNGGLQSNLDSMIKATTDGKYRVSRVMDLWAFNVNTLEELVTRLNSDGLNIARRLWSFSPEKLHPAGIAWDSESDKFRLKD